VTPRYPRELEERLHLPGLGPVLLRPIRPEDAAQYRRGFAALPPEDIRRRFHMPLGRLSDAMIERLTCIDYETDMAFVLEALDPEQGAIHGGTLVAVGRLVGDEAALLVCLYRRRLGIGRLLLLRLAAHARRRRHQELRGDIQADNPPMLALAARLGCVLVPVPGAADLVRAALPLT
jgi:GNAT superfamily N-acetyltransferase